MFLSEQLLILSTPKRSRLKNFWKIDLHPLSPTKKSFDALIFNAIGIQWSLRHCVMVSVILHKQRQEESQNMPFARWVASIENTCFERMFWCYTKNNRTSLETVTVSRGASPLLYLDSWNNFNCIRNGGRCKIRLGKCKTFWLFETRILKNENKRHEMFLAWFHSFLTKF